MECYRETLRENLNSERFVVTSFNGSSKFFIPLGPVTNLFSATTCHGFLPRTSLGSRTAVSSTFKRHTVPFEPSSVNEWIDSLGVKDRKKKSGEENCIDRMMKVSSFTSFPSKIPFKLSYSCRGALLVSTRMKLKLRQTYSLKSRN